MSLDPQVQAVVDQIALLDPPSSSAQTPEQLRAAFEMFGSMSPRAPGVEADDDVWERLGAPVPFRLYRPAGAAGAGSLAALVYFHGGGHVFGSPASHDGATSLLSAAGEFAVLSVDYRLAPEHPFPADVEDADAIVAWVAKHASDLGIDAGRLAVGGDSAGGNLAAVNALHTRDRGGPALAAVLLVYPWVDLTCVRPSMTENASGYVLTVADLEHWRSLYVADPGRWPDPDVSALHAPDLSGLPPTVVVTAGYDPLRDQGDAFAARLAEAGTEVHHRRFPHLIHTFIQLGALSDAARAATEEIARDVAKLLAR